MSLQLGVSDSGNGYVHRRSDTASRMASTDVVMDELGSGSVAIAARWADQLPRSMTERMVERTTSGRSA